MTTTGNDGFFPHSTTRHGTLTGYDRHRERGTPICADCQRCRVEYDRRYRRDRRIRERARQRAFQRLRDHYPATYARLYEEEQARSRAEVDEEDAARAELAARRTSLAEEAS